MRDPFTGIDTAALDRHITGNWGMDAPGFDEDDEQEEMCSNPGRYGCGSCIGCDAWADGMMDRDERDDYSHEY